MSTAHDFAPVAGEPGVERCTRPGCTVRRSQGGAWQRKKGGHWRSPPLPPCAGYARAVDVFGAGSSTCSATWSGGQCTRPRRSNGLCAGHLGQQRRQRQFSELRAPHGADPRELVAITVMLPAEHVEAVSAQASRSGTRPAELYREAVATFLARPGA